MSLRPIFPRVLSSRALVQLFAGLPSSAAVTCRWVCRRGAVGTWVPRVPSCPDAGGLRPENAGAGGWLWARSRSGAAEALSSAVDLGWGCLLSCWFEV